MGSHGADKLLELEQNTCNSATCVNGNCAGCKDGTLWCYDPRCEPYCRGCRMDSNHDLFVSLTVILVILGIVMIIVVLMMFFGPPMITPVGPNDTLRYNEM